MSALALLTSLALAGCSDAPDTEPADVTDAPVLDDLDADQAAACEDLLARLPETLEEQTRRQVAPDGALAAVWGDPEIVLRCGVAEPALFNVVAPCLTVDGVDWFVPGTELQAPEGPDVVLTVVKRLAVVEVTLPVDYGPPAALLADLSGPVSQAVPATGRCR